MSDWQEKVLRGEAVPWADIVSAGAKNWAQWERDFAHDTARIVPERDYLWQFNRIGERGERIYNRITLLNFRFRGANRGVVTEVVEQHVDALQLAAQDRQADPRPVQERDGDAGLSPGERLVVG